MGPPVRSAYNDGLSYCSSSMYIVNRRQRRITLACRLVAKVCLTSFEMGFFALVACFGDTMVMAVLTHDHWTLATGVDGDELIVNGLRLARHGFGSAGPCRELLWMVVACVDSVGYAEL